MLINCHKITINTVCVLCLHTVSLTVNENDCNDYMHGKPVVEAFPYLSAGERELLISGICPDCWDKMYAGLKDDAGDEDEDEDYEDEYEYYDDYDDCDNDMGYDPYEGYYIWDC